MKNINKILYYLPAIVVLVVLAVIIAVNYSSLPAEIPTKFRNGEASQLAPRWTLWLFWGLGVVICALMAISVRIPVMRKNAFRIKLWNKTVVNAQDLLSPDALEMLYGVMASATSLLFLLISCAIIFPSLRILMLILLIILGSLILIGAVAFSVILTKRAVE